MKILRWLTGGMLLGLVATGSARPAAAELTDDNGCTASAVWTSNGMTVDATQTGTVTIPRADTVQWQGSVPAAPGAYEGSIWVELPPPFGDVEIDAWSGESQATANAGVEEYDLPSAVPAGMPITVHGRHVDDNGVCAGSVTFEIDGSPLSSPVAWASLGGTLVMGATGFVLVRPMFRRVV